MIHSEIEKCAIKRTQTLLLNTRKTELEKKSSSISRIIYLSNIRRSKLFKLMNEGFD